MNKLLYLLLLGVCLIACTDEDNLSETSVIQKPAEPKSETDRWIRQEYTMPYNVEVVYKWTDAETDIGKNLVPPHETAVVPFLDVIKKVWIDSYVAEAGVDFFKELTPKQMLLIGSPSFNNDGTYTQGQAEGGKKITLFDINGFSPKNKALLVSLVHVIHHEFAHIMHQTIHYNVAFKKITPAGYTATWMNTPNAQALKEGFITNYAKASPDEDFVEMISVLLTNSPEDWNALVASAGTTGSALIRQKEAIMANYLRTEWGIDVYRFQRRMAAVIDEVSK